MLMIIKKAMTNNNTYIAQELHIFFQNYLKSRYNSFQFH